MQKNVRVSSWNFLLLLIGFKVSICKKGCPEKHKKSVLLNLLNFHQKAEHLLRLIIKMCALKTDHKRDWCPRKPMIDLFISEEGRILQQTTH